MVDVAVFSPVNLLQVDLIKRCIEKKVSLK